MTADSQKSTSSLEFDPLMSTAGTESDGATRYSPHFAGIDSELIARTKNQIRTLVQEISDLANSDCELERFLEGFLTRTTSALGGMGGAVWLVNADQRLELAYQINMAQALSAGDASAQAQHARLLQKVFESGQSALVPPRSGDGASQEGNPSECLLIFGVLRVDQQVAGLIEIFQRAGAGAATHRGFQRFVVQMSDVASNYLKNRRLRQFSGQRELWQRLEQYIQAVHQSLDAGQTAFAIANEGRRLIDCDRLSVAIRRGDRCAIQAVSGLDTLDRRAGQIKDLSRLTTAVVRGRNPLWYSPSSSELAPQLEKYLHRYIDRSHTKSLAVVPLCRQPPESQRQRRPADSRIIGALIVEQLTQTDFSSSMRQRIDAVATHSQDALVNALDHSGIFLLPVWKSLGRASGLFLGDKLARTLMVMIVLAAAISALGVVPYPFTLGANGQLNPKSRCEIFASVNGTLDEILVPEDPNAIVEPGDVLAVLTNNELVVSIRDLEGQQKQLQERIRNLERAFSEKLERLDQLQIEKEMAEAVEQKNSVASQLQVKQRQMELLRIVAPVRGHVVNWQLRQNLLRRPVQTGQNLMTIVAPDSDWEVELSMPEKRVAHLLQAAGQTDQPLSVTFSLASHPGHEFRGTVRQVDKRLEVRGTDGNAARVLVDFDEHQLPQELLRIGTRVTAQVHCGTRSLGYVWFREIGESIYATWLRWF